MIELTSENARLQQQVETLETSPNFDIEREKRQVVSLQSKLEFAQREAELLRQQQDALEAEAARAMEQEAHATQRCHQLVRFSSLYLSFLLLLLSFYALMF